MAGDKPGRVLFLFALLFLMGCEFALPTGPSECNEEGALLSDGFLPDRRCGWAEYNRGGAVVAIEDEVLRITSSQPGQIWWTNPGRTFDDVIVNVLARQVDGPDDNAYGLICRYQSPENFYVFLISGDGYYAIGIYQSGNNQVVYLSGDGQYVPTDAINQGAALNELRATCIGDELSLWINGLQVATVRDDTFPAGDIGLAASTFASGTTAVEFDDVAVLAP